MSGESSGADNGHYYGFPPNGTRQDRYTQNIIDHTNSLFPELDSHIPRFHAPYSLGAEGSGILGPLNDDNHLDNFGELEPLSRYGNLGIL